MGRVRCRQLALVPSATERFRGSNSIHPPMAVATRSRLISLARRADRARRHRSRMLGRDHPCRRGADPRRRGRAAARHAERRGAGDGRHRTRCAGWQRGVFGLGCDIWRSRWAWGHSSSKRRFRHPSMPARPADARGDRGAPISGRLAQDGSALLRRNLKERATSGGRLFRRRSAHRSEAAHQQQPGSGQRHRQAAVRSSIRTLPPLLVENTIELTSWNSVVKRTL